MYNLRDFPDYRIDTQTGRVYSNRCKTKEKEIHGFINGNKGSQMKFGLITTEGKTFNASIGRLIAAAQYGCSYFDLPKDVMFNWTLDGGLTMRDRRENAMRGHAGLRKRQAEVDRIAILDRTVKEMGLIREAYLGNSEPLAKYVFGRREVYVRLAMASRLSQGVGGQPGVDSAVGAAIDIFIDNVLNGTQNIVLIEPWIVKTALGIIKNRKANAHKFFDIEDKKTAYLMNPTHKR
jgi:hypothetical protein